VTHALTRLLDRALDRPTPLVVGLALALGGLAVFVGFDLASPVLILALVVGLVASPFVVLRNDRVFAIFFFILAAFQWMPRRFEWIPVGYHPVLAMGLLTLIGWNFIRERLDRGDLTWPRDSIKTPWILLGLWVTWSAVHGYTRGNSESYLQAEILIAAHYLLYLPAIDALTTPRRIALVLAALALGVLAASAEYFVAGVTASFADNRWGRVISRQANLVVTAAPFAVAMALVVRRHAWMWLLGLAPCLVLVLFSQQRSLFIGLPVAILAALVLGFRAPSVVRRRVLVIVLGAVLLLGGLWTVLSSVRVGHMGSVTESVATRGEASEFTEASSLLIRFASWHFVWENRIKERPLEGWGLGNTAEIPVLRQIAYGSVGHVDNTYILLTWKMGLVGLALFLTLYLAALWRGWQLLRHPRPEVQALAIGILASLLGALFISLASSMVSNYRFNAIWTVYMAILAVAPRVFPADPDARPAFGRYRPTRPLDPPPAAEGGAHRGPVAPPADPSRA